MESDIKRGITVFTFPYFLKNPLLLFSSQPTQSFKYPKLLCPFLNRK